MLTRKRRLLRNVYVITYHVIIFNLYVNAQSSKHYPLKLIEETIEKTIPNRRIEGFHNEEKTVIRRRSYPARRSFCDKIRVLFPTNYIIIEILFHEDCTLPYKLI